MVDTSAVKGEKVDLRFTVLRGTVGVSEAGHPVALGGAQQRRVLAAFLAEAGVVVSADRLVEAVWPDGSAPEGARRTAMSYVSRLRAAIGADHLVTRDNGYVLELGGATYDAAEFEALLAEARQLVGEEAVLAVRRRARRCGRGGPSGTTGTSGGCSRSPPAWKSSASWPRRTGPSA